VLPWRGGDAAYAVHQVHADVRPGVDVVYGRRGDASAGRGCAVARVADRDGGFAFVAVTYRFPVVSALAVERLVAFADGELRALLADGTPA
jgi:hypothetical protein